MRKSIIATSTAALILSMLPHSADAALVGKKCSKRGIERVVGSTKLVCSGKNRLTWKRVPIKVSPTPTPTPTSAASDASSQNGSELNLPVETSLETLLPSGECKIGIPSTPGLEYQNFGFPRSSELLPSSGEISVLVINVDFQDFPAKVSPQENTAPFVKPFEDYWKEVSRGKLKFKVETFSNWISLPKTAYEYAGPEPHFNIDKYAQEVLDRADPQVDFGKFGVVAIIPTSDVRNFIKGGPVLASAKFDKYKTQEGPIFNLTVAGEPDVPMGGVKWLWLAHEVGHMLGLSHPHQYEGNVVERMSIFSLMDSGFVAPGLYGLERWRMGWIEESEIRCVGLAQANKSKVFRLRPLGSESGAQLLVLLINSHEAVFIENRRATEFDKLTSAYEGISVYFVNSRLADGAITPLLPDKYLIDYSKPEYNGTRVVGTLKLNQIVNFGKINIKVVAESEKDYFVQISEER